MHRICRILALVAALLGGGQAMAGEVVIGLGRDDIRGLKSPATGGFLEVRARPFAQVLGADFGLGVAIEADTDGDTWAGGGVVGAIGLAPGVRLVPSVMVGLYRDGGGNDLAQDFPVFRTNLGVDGEIGAGWRLGATLGHKSNAFTGRSNPGVESLYLTIGRRF